MFICIHADRGEYLPPSYGIADFAYNFSPFVEETSKDTAVIDVKGCELIFGSVYELANHIANRAEAARDEGGLGSKVNVAIAANPDAAIYAACFYKGVSFIAQGEELTGLGDLPVESFKFRVAPEQTSAGQLTGKQILDLDHQALEEKQLIEILETLQLWGVRTFRDLALLPTAGVSERLGQAGVKLQQLAAGKTSRHLKLKQQVPVFSYSLELDHPIAELEPLSFIFARLLNRLCAALHSYALATNELHVRLKLEDQNLHERILNLPHPLRDNKVFLKLLLLDTEMHPPASPVMNVSISCEPVKPRVLQNGLFIPLAPEPEKLELTLARLTKLLGAENVGSPELIDTHRPDAFLVKRFSLPVPLKKKRRPPSQDFSNERKDLSNENIDPPLLGFRVFRPPIKAMVEFTRGYPTQLNAWNKDLSVHGKIVELAGPWRTTGDWWRMNNWARDEWDVAVERRGRSDAVNDDDEEAFAKVLYRIYRDLRDGAWFIEGSYD